MSLLTFLAYVMDWRKMARRKVVLKNRSHNPQVAKKPSKGFLASCLRTIGRSQAGAGCKAVKCEDARDLSESIREQMAEN